MRAVQGLFLEIRLGIEGLCVVVRDSSVQCQLVNGLGLCRGNRWYDFPKSSAAASGKSSIKSASEALKSLALDRADRHRDIGYLFA